MWADIFQKKLTTVKKMTEKQITAMPNQIVGSKSIRCLKNQVVNRKKSVVITNGTRRSLTSGIWRLFNVPVKRSPKTVTIGISNVAITIRK